jgi:2-dehydro-3-deoxygalactonokinase
MSGTGFGEAALVAIDWGTSHARAYVVDTDGRVVAERAAPVGVGAIRDGDFGGALARLLGDWTGLAVPRVASGMIGSRQGWVEAPYVTCPAGATSVAAAMARTPGGELAVIPGVIVRDEAGIPDVIRGEETQIFGAVRDDERDLLAVLPGTHSKWVHVARGRIVEFETHMTGELYAVLLAHSLLGRLADAAYAPDAPGPAFARGVARGLAGGGLGHLIFGARSLALTGELAPIEVPDWLSGLLIGREIRSARTWANRRGLDAARVRVIGGDALVARYREALAQADIDAEAGPGDAAVRGIARVARLANLIH